MTHELVGSALSEALPEILSDALGLVDAPDPWDTELLASELLGIAEADGDLGLTPASEVLAVSEVVRCIARHPGPPALALLLALTAVAPPEGVQLAEEASTELIVRGIPVPRWAGALGTAPEVVGCMHRAESQDGEEVVIVAFARPDLPAHGIATVVADGGEGALQTAFPVEPASYIGAVGGTGPAFEPFEPGTAAAVLEHATRAREHAAGSLAAAPDYSAMRALLRARTRLLPAAAAVAGRR